MRVFWIAVLLILLTCTISYADGHYDVVWGRNLDGTYREIDRRLDGESMMDTIRWHVDLTLTYPDGTVVEVNGTIKANKEDDY